MSAAGVFGVHAREKEDEEKSHAKTQRRKGKTEAKTIH
jgi:hypothetical protein